MKKLTNAGFIYPVEDSKWVSPVVVTPKKNGKWWVCVDYKPLNTTTKRYHFPLPFQEEILNEVAGHERYTVCDGYLGYFQISIVEEDQKKTTFITPWGCFSYRVMPFGFTNAPVTFQRKILQAGFVWPSLQRDAHFWCKTCDVCHRMRPRRLICGPQ